MRAEYDFSGAVRGKWRPKLFYVDTGFACGGVAVNGNKIIDAPPIWRGWIGRAWSSFQAYYKPIRMEEIYVESADKEAQTTRRP